MSEYDNVTVSIETIKCEDKFINWANDNSQIMGVLLALFAGLCTFIGGFTVFLPIKQHQMRLASCACLAAASGVMAYVSLVEVFGESTDKFHEAINVTELLKNSKKETLALTFGTVSFFAGWIMAVLMAKGLDSLMDRTQELKDQDELAMEENGTLVNGHMEHDNFDEISNAKVRLNSEREEEVAFAQKRFNRDTNRIKQLGWQTALALTLHNIPEGLITYVSAQVSVTAGIGLAIAIGLHNIPEGFAVAMPVYIGSNKSKMKAMFWSGITGFAEPLGALIGMAMLTAFTDAKDIEEDSTSLFIFGILFGLTAGIMTSVAIKQLLLEAVRYDPTDDVTSIAWAIGALVIAISLIAIAAVEESEHC